ncbi:hypothetical protein PSP6_410050 [Paraburkholderia tropica]|nr:hypothetical protein PSP6_410050 [Paraburkholderia tropica]
MMMGNDAVVPGGATWTGAANGVSLRPEAA